MIVIYRDINNNLIIIKTKNKNKQINGTYFFQNPYFLIISKQIFTKNCKSCLFMKETNLWFLFILKIVAFSFVRKMWL